MNTYKNIKQTYLLAVFTAVLITVFNQMVIQYWLYQKNNDSRVINIAGRQRMLSQKLNVFFYKIREHEPNQREALLTTFALWSKTHQGLMHGDTSLHLTAIDNVAVLQQLKALNPHIAFIEHIIKHNTPLDVNVLSQITQNQATFLQKMEHIVGLLEVVSDDKLHKIIILEILLAAISLAVIIFEILWIFKPINKKMQTQWYELTAESKRYRATKNKLRAILNSSTDNNILIDADYKILSVNRVAAQNIKMIWDKDPEEGESIFNYVLPENEAPFRQKLDEALQGKHIIAEKELFITPLLSVWYELTFYPVYDEDGILIGASFIATDIDKRKRAEQQILAQNLKLQKIAWQQSHEVRSPVANILGIITFIKQTESIDENTHTYFMELLHNECKRLDAIIHAIVEQTVELKKAMQE